MIDHGTDRHQTAASDDLSREVYCILGMPIDAADMQGVITSIQAAAACGTPFVISTPNVNFLINSQEDPLFREALLLSDLCPPDGAPIVWIARLIGLPIRDRVAGSDIFETLKGSPSYQRPIKVVLFGGTELAAATACKRLNAGSTGLHCVGFVSPGFGTIDELSQDRFIEQINSSNADFLVAALGAKKGLLWLQRNHDRLRIPVRAHLGATINFQAGLVGRAPFALRKLGLEWLWRIKEEPHLWRRYWHDGSVLLRLMLTRVLPIALHARWLQLRVWGGRCDLRITPAESEGVLTLRLAGDATAGQVLGATTHFRDAMASGKRIVIDLSKTRVVDARFLGLLLVLRKELKGRGATLGFAGVSRGLEEYFRLNGVDHLLSSSETS